MLDDEVRQLVAEELKLGSIVEFAESQRVFDFVEVGFPLGLNRIAWEKVARKEYAEIYPVGTGGTTAEDTQGKLEAHREQVRRWLESAGVLPSAGVSWVGDATNIGLTMKAETLVDAFPRLFSLPQHSYVFPEDGSWCLNYVMEGELFFANAGVVPRRK